MTVYRKAPNRRHFYVYQENRGWKSGLNPHWIREKNTVIIPGIPVDTDVRLINQEISNVKVKRDKDTLKWVKKTVFDFAALGVVLAESVLLMSIPSERWAVLSGSWTLLYLSVSLLTVSYICLSILYFFKSGIIFNGKLFLGLFIIYIILVITIAKAPLAVIFALVSGTINGAFWGCIFGYIRSVFAKGSVEWQVNGRVYGEHRNEQGEFVLFPKSGKGFHCLTATDYRKLTAYQITNGNHQEAQKLLKKWITLDALNRNNAKLDGILTSSLKFLAELLGKFITIIGQTIKMGILINLGQLVQRNIGINRPLYVYQECESALQNLLNR
jgi:hypothetical protein